jgi:hypothetical protein
MLIMLYGCGDKMNKRLTLWRNDKIPYGTYYAYENIHHFFDDAEIAPSSASPETFDREEKGSAYVIIGKTVRPSERELDAILSHVYAGNKVFISALDIGKNLLDSLTLKVKNESGYYDFDDSLTISVEDKDEVSSSFTYPGFRMDNYFSSMDTGYTTVLGRTKGGHANFVRISFNGGGTIMIHLSPVAFSNFFLLHKENKKYYDLAMSAIPDTVNYVRWDDYYRRHINGEDIDKPSGFSKLGEILKNETLSWAFWLTLLLFAIIYIFESKRKQRIIKPLVQPANTSLDFVQTVGRLYFQRRDNKNLATKIVTHFLGHIRSAYNLPTSALDEEFEKRLAFKSGYSIETIKNIIEDIKSIEAKPSLNDEELLALNDKLEKFYKPT